LDADVFAFFFVLGAEDLEFGGLERAVETRVSIGLLVR